MTDPKPKKSNRLAIALAISLSLNLLIVGMVGGAFLAGGPRGGIDARQARGALGSFGVFAQAMTDADRRAVRQSLRENRAQFQRGRRDVRLEIGKVVEALRADPFDPNTLQAVFAAQKSRAVDQVTLGQRVFLDRVGAMNQNQRREYSDRLETIAKRRAIKR